MLNREEMFHHLVDEHTHWDIIIIGGGASGLWTALDGATRGYKTLLIEKHDFASSASSKSTKLIHGGVRYLKQGHLSLVREALLERGYLCKNAPHLIYPRPFILGCYNWWEKPFYRFGINLYDGMAGSLVLEKSSSYSTAECLKHCPTLNSHSLKGGVVYYDGQFDDAKLAIELAKTIELYGGSIINYCDVKSFLKASGKVCGVLCQDCVTGKSFEVQSRVVINATGVFTDELRKLDNSTQKEIMSLSRGTHIVVDAKFFPSDHAFVIPKTSDERVVFLVPWLGKVLIGTTDIQTDRPMIEPTATEEEIDFLLKEVNPFLTHPITKPDILSSFAGLRPLVRSSDISKTAKLVRKHKIFVSPSGLITLTGGKWTIGRKMAEDCIDTAIHSGHFYPISCKTKRLKLHETPHEIKGDKLHPNLPYYENDLKIAIEEEMPVHLTDLLARRTRCLFLDAKATLSIAPKAVSMMAHHFKQDKAWEKKELEAFTQFAASYQANSPIQTLV